VDMYREGPKHVHALDRFVNDQVAARCLLHCGEDDEEARNAATPEGVWFVNKAEELYQHWQGRQALQSYRYAVTAVQTERVDKTVEDHLASGAFAMGDPDTVIKVLKGYQEAGLDQVLCFRQLGDLAYTRIMDSIKLVGRHVIPYFR